MQSLAEAVRQISFFSGLSREDLARIAGRLEEEKFSAGHFIIKQGAVDDALYIVRSGAVEVLLEHEGLRPESVAVLGPYECFGEMALFTGQKRSASVRALVDCGVLKLSKENWEELLAGHPSLSLHFCKVLSRRLAVTDRDISTRRRAFNLVIEGFLSAQPADVQDFLIQTSILKTLDLGAIQSVLSSPDPNQILATLSSSQPAFVRAKNGDYEYPDYLRDFLSAKQEQRASKNERNDLHLRFASYFSSHGKWALAIYHFVQAEGQSEAIELLETHGDELLEKEAPNKVLGLLDALPLHVRRSRGRLARIQAEAHVRLGDLESAIATYEAFVVEGQVCAEDAVNMTQCYQRLAELHWQKGRFAAALGWLRLGESLVAESGADMDAVRSMHSIGILQQKFGLPDATLRWGQRTLNLARKLAMQGRTGVQGWNRRWVSLFLAFAVGLGLWQVPPPAPLDESGMAFLASLAAAVLLWILNAFDEYVVAVMLLVSWLLLGVVPAELALGGFSK